MEAPDRAGYVLLEDLIAMHVGELFPGFRTVSCTPFRVTRDSDLTIDEDDPLVPIPHLGAILLHHERFAEDGLEQLDQRVDPDLQVGGLIASVGQRMLGGVSKMMADKFFNRMSELLQAP